MTRLGRAAFDHGGVQNGVPMLPRRTSGTVCTGLRRSASVTVETFPCQDWACHVQKHNVIPRSLAWFKGTSARKLNCTIKYGISNQILPKPGFPGVYPSNQVCDCWPPQARPRRAFLGRPPQPSPGCRISRKRPTCSRRSLSWLSHAAPTRMWNDAESIQDSEATSVLYK